MKKILSMVCVVAMLISLVAFSTITASAASVPTISATLTPFVDGDEAPYESGKFATLTISYSGFESLLSEYDWDTGSGSSISSFSVRVNVPGYLDGTFTRSGNIVKGSLFDGFDTTMASPNVTSKGYVGASYSFGAEDTAPFAGSGTIATLKVKLAKAITEPINLTLDEENTYVFIQNYVDFTEEAKTIVATSADGFTGFTYKALTLEGSTFGPSSVPTPPAEEVFADTVVAKKALDANDTMKDETDGNDIAATGKVAAIFAKNVTDDVLNAGDYGIVFGGVEYVGLSDVPAKTMWAVKLVDPSAEILKVGNEYTYDVFAKGQTTVTGLTFIVE